MSLPGRRPFRRGRRSGALGRDRVYPGGGRSGGRDVSGPRAELEPYRKDTVHAGAAHRGPERTHRFRARPRAQGQTACTFIKKKTRYVYQEKDPVRLSRKSLPRRRAGLQAEIEPAREETVQTGAPHRPTRPTGGALGQTPCRRARPSGAPGGARVYLGGGRSDGRGLAEFRAELESTREEAVQTGEA
ncbi:hypothetical protein PoB_005580700 [Plakobranchus ocellatus]|uniref:Uncharacterized protein n=1 Tax=Plakobranchus ocellatus TaxID=259542 RepID=A0AAV4CD99_9GAST|nr:hypothetical protein PoB_005580700 [Plakobranchus ocellatus]